ncbi:MAG: hypothetical protein HC882_00910 [Acidobacteria bacterium]|nr:hypothetical protein [Acidobacteriota bacterium]
MKLVPHPTVLTISTMMREAMDDFQSGKTNVIAVLRVSSDGKMYMDVGAHTAGDPNPATPDDVAHMINAVPHLLDALSTILEELKKSRN